MYSFYRGLTVLLSPFIPLILKRRLGNGKEDAARINERTGYSTLSRPEKKLIWIHAASVGETNSVLPLIKQLLEKFSDVSVLLTTVTLTSTKLIENKLPLRAFHQFAPVDTPDAVIRFLKHWRPDIALWVDSELWANMIVETKRSGAVMGLINARMSPGSFARWQKFASSLIKQLLSSFDFAFVQSTPDSEYLTKLGMKHINAVCNLKYDAPALAFDENELNTLKEQTKNRKIWLASSTHPGEEKIIAEVHKQLSNAFPDLLTIIVPRHAKRGDDIKQELQEYGAIAQRSKKEGITEKTAFYIADTMGELGIFYRLAPIVFIGGTLVPHGGQNALEPARIGCAIITAKHYHNFVSVVEDMLLDKAIIKITSPDEMVSQIKSLFNDEVKRQAYSMAAKIHAESKSGAIAKILDCLQDYLTK